MFQEIFRVPVVSRRPCNHFKAEVRYRSTRCNTQFARPEGWPSGLGSAPAYAPPCGGLLPGKSGRGYPADPRLSWTCGHPPHGTLHGAFAEEAGHGSRPVACPLSRSQYRAPCAFSSAAPASGCNAATVSGEWPRRRRRHHLPRCPRSSAAHSPPCDSALPSRLVALVAPVSCGPRSE
jgi:hypothetical protein